MQSNVNNDLVVPVYDRLYHPNTLIASYATHVDAQAKKVMVGNQNLFFMRRIPSLATDTLCHVPAIVAQNTQSAEASHYWSRDCE